MKRIPARDAGPPLAERAGYGRDRKIEAKASLARAAPPARPAAREAVAETRGKR